MLPRARQNNCEDGFVIIEVLVSALILAVVAGAVLALITATTHSAASERNRSVAYGLAQEAQARMRTMRLASLNGELPPETTKVGGTEYVIRSSGRFVNNMSGTRSCSSGEASADYVEITSTVSSTTLPNPVSIHSVVAPSNGSLDPSHGTLAIQATNGEGKPVSGVTASITGPTNATASTGEEGCVIFADIPAPTNNTYRLTTGGNGLINREGKTEETLPTVNVPASGTQQISVYWDRAGQIAPQFVYAEPGGGLQSAAIDSMMVYNSEGGKPAAVYGTPGTVTSATPLEANPVFPFAATYAVYAGSCTKDLPEPSNSPAIGNVKVKSGLKATPQIQVPALNALVTYEGGNVIGATVTLTDSKCPEIGTKVKRTFTTNQIGHVAVGTAGTTQAIGLPWSSYQVCASAKLKNAANETEYRRLEVANPLSVETVAAPITTTLNLSGTGSTGSKSTELKCP